jgi:acetyl-CoA carboxylase, biotin carboxylase subunit
VSPAVKKITRVLIANRGEIAVRIARTLREMGITPIAVYSEVDRTAPHVRACELAVELGPAPANESYLVIDKILAAAKQTGADAIHPGYGFLSENAGFAEAVTRAGLTFIGPSADAMRVMGSKTGARRAVTAAKVPVVPGTPPMASVEEARSEAKKLGYPVMIKASSGGGGKGMRLVASEAELESAYRGARSEAKSAFGDDTVYLEKAILEPKHIEIQIFGGPDGKAVWLGERECSMQRRHQKVIEETPSPAIDEATRAAMGAVAVRAAEAVAYTGAGTCEFLFDPASKNFYFLEMNTRLQVEHPVTELCCGTDLVEAQVRVARGEPLPWRQEQIVRRGHAIEARLYAEDPSRNFMPSPGDIVDLVLPQGPGVRVDCGVASGFTVPRFYDPMIAKIAVWAEDRERARKKLLRALAETAVKGITTNGAFLRTLLAAPSFADGTYHTGSIVELMAAGSAPTSEHASVVGMLAAVVQQYRKDLEKSRQAAQGGARGGRSSAWRSIGRGGW